MKKNQVNPGQYARMEPITKSIEESLDDGFINCAIIDGRVVEYTIWDDKLGERKWVFTFASSSGSHKKGEITNISSKLTPADCKLIRRYIQKKCLTVGNGLEKNLTHSGNNQNGATSRQNSKASKRRHGDNVR